MDKTGEHIIETPVEISIIASDEVLLVALRFRSGADREAIECCMFQIVDALAAVEGICEKDLQGLFWERRRLSPTEQCVTLRRKFSDPDYPRKFDVAFRRLKGHFDPIRVH